MINNLKKSFLDKGIFLKDSWLNSIVDSGHKSYDSIFISLLNTDISETCEPCPLPNITKDPIFKFEENDPNFSTNQIFLQINEVIDISLPLEKRRALERSEQSTFKIFLTDGVNNFVGISKKPITSFSTDVIPGAKIYIKAPFESRYGIIFLSDENIEFLKGKSVPVIEQRKLIFSKIANQSNQKQNQQQNQSKNASKPQQQNQIKDTSRTQQFQQKPNSAQNSHKNQTSKFLDDSSDDDDDDYYSTVDETMNQGPIKTINTINKNNKQLYDSSVESESSFLEDSSEIESIDESDFDKLPSNTEKQNKKNMSMNNQILSSDIDDNYDFDSSDDNVIILDKGNSSNRDKNSDSKIQHHFLTDDESDIDFSHEVTESNNNNHIYDKSHALTVKELKMKKNVQQEECFEVVNTSANISECCDFHFEEKGKKKYFTMKVILQDDTGKIPTKVDPDRILSIIQMSPDEFLDVSDEKMEEYFTKLKNYFLQLEPPLSLIDGGGSIDDRYTLSG